MKRIHIRLTEDQERAVRRRAAKIGSSVAAVVRDAVERLLATDDADPRHQHVMEVFGKYASDARDVSEKHDRYLAQEFDR